jgi:multicomponent Na+:H+ antiporter subunit D
MDPLGAIFALLTLVIFLCSGVFATDYMKEKEHKRSFFIFFILSGFIEIMLCAASNLVTFYMCYELLTVLTVPLVIHDRTKEAKMSALKYLFFSMFGAYGALFGIYNLAKYSDTLDFIQGGSVPASVYASDQKIILIAAMALIMGFGVKAGMWPLHAWLPSAHPIAPAPASAALSACIVKAGVLGIIRSLWYVLGADKLKGTAVQTAFMTLALLTVFMGSMLAYRESVLKKRLAYSTVSQVSYILFGLAISMGQTGVNSAEGAISYPNDALVGAILHVLAHGFIKAALFLVAGAIIHHLKITKVEDMRGIGMRMPFTMCCYTVVSLGLIGIPPTGGFISKWYLATGALASDIPVFSWLGPVILLVSALLTAGYLLTPAVWAFFPGAEYRSSGKDLSRSEVGPLMTVPIATLTLLSVLIGIFPDQTVALIRQIFTYL